MDIQAPEIANAIARFFNVYGRPTLRGVDETVYPVFVVGGIESSQGKRSSGTLVQTALLGALGTFPRITFGNPLITAGPRVRVIPKWVSVPTGINAFVQMTLGKGIWAIPSGTIFLSDPYLAPATAKLDNAASVAIQGQPVMQFGATALLYPFPSTLLDPGDSINFTATIADTVFTLDLWWEEEPVP